MRNSERPGVVAFQYLTGTCRHDGERPFPKASTTRGSGFKQKENRFRLETRRNSLLWGCWGIGTDFPEKLRMPHHKCSRLGWTRLCAIRFSERCPCPCQRGWTKVIFRGPFKPKTFSNPLFMFVLYLVLCVCTYWQYMFNPASSCTGGHTAVSALPLQAARFGPIFLTVLWFRNYTKIYCSSSYEFDHYLQ